MTSTHKQIIMYLNEETSTHVCIKILCENLHMHLYRETSTNICTTLPRRTLWLLHRETLTNECRPTNIFQLQTVFKVFPTHNLSLICEITTNNLTCSRNLSRFKITFYKISSFVLMGNEAHIDLMSPPIYNITIPAETS